ncbi:hypothetical protein CLV30_12857 [Haloactinopolyspora alba]|uniref:Uncharacterized protein n=1 Tax=Haloactinopolyspora alba TaxID=648780 RepID=A0A2P8DF04_9ACTN|nr:hypothetical protein [Haloactinopolyspora alba]PSK95805.1 hypothetical protein CLV30_12857 [Haloactinopolyspora alba]
MKRPRLRRRIQRHHLAGLVLGIALFVSNPPDEPPTPADAPASHVCQEATS